MFKFMVIVHFGLWGKAPSCEALSTLQHIQLHLHVDGESEILNSFPCFQYITMHITALTPARKWKAHITVHTASALTAREAHLHWKVVWGCATLKSLFFRQFFSSKDPSFQALFQLQRPHFYFLKNFAFSTHFLLNFSS